jgi:hypothetical protein
MTKPEIFDEDNEILIEDDYSSNTITFYPDRKRFTVDFYLKEDAFASEEIFEYKISTDPIEVYIRLLQSSTEPPLEYKVKDGVVLESEILKNNSISGASSVEELKKSVEWHKLQLVGGHLVMLYVLTKHPEIISKEDARKFLRQSAERIKTGLMKIEKFLKEKPNNELQILEREYSIYIWYPDDKRRSTDEEQKKAVEYVETEIQKPLFTPDSVDYSGISLDEFGTSKEILGFIEDLLSKIKVTNAAVTTPVAETVQNVSHTKVNNDRPQAKKMSIGVKWLIVIAISIIALSGGIWTAIGVFILGSIIIGVLAN